MYPNFRSDTRVDADWAESMREAVSEGGPLATEEDAVGLLEPDVGAMKRLCVNVKVSMLLSGCVAPSGFTGVKVAI